MRVPVQAWLFAGAMGAAMMTASAAHAARCIDLASPEPGGIPAAGCTIGGTASNFVNLTDSSLDPAILWTGTTHTVGANANDDEVDIEAAIDHVFDQFIDLQFVIKLDPDLTGGGFTITPTDGSPSFGNFTQFDWNYTGTEQLAVMTLKIATSVIIFDVSGMTSGSVANTLVLGGGGNPQGISHVSWWATGSTAVSEPAMLGMLMGGLGGMALLRRRAA